MIIDNISNKERYQHLPEIYAVLADLSGEPIEHYVKSVTTIINTLSFTSKMEKECLYENHHHYLDIHFILAGVEKIKLSPVDELSIIEEYNVEKDIMFLEGDSQVEVLLKEGDFLICYPGEAHKVGISGSYEESTIRKQVGKIKCN